MTGRETHHMHVPGQCLRQGGSDPGLKTCQVTGIAQQSAECAFSGRGEPGTGSVIATTPGAAVGFIGRHGTSPA